VVGERVIARPVTAADHSELIAFFQRAECACHCQYWSFPGDHRDWQLRLATEPEKNARALEEGLAAGRVRGVVGLLNEAIIGWSRLAPPTDLGRLYEGRLYKGLPCFQGDRTSVMAVGCVLVEARYRRRGVARALLAAQVELARSLGAQTLEAFPRGAVDVSDGEQWMGPLAVYVELGFERIHDFAPYPVMQMRL
jgi:GNAT superfamily N-acetyltransferase